MCVSCFWGGRLVPYAPLRKNSLTLVSLLRESFTISYSCHLGGRVGSRREVWQGSHYGLEENSLGYGLSIGLSLLVFV